jgi:hypothetical protein
MLGSASLGPRGKAKLTLGVVLRIDYAAKIPGYNPAYFFGIRMAGGIVSLIFELAYAILNRK